MKLIVRPSVLVLVLLATMFAIEVSTAATESPVIDEAVHLTAGLSYWQTGDWRLNPEHPPLLKLLSTFPLLFTSASIPTDHPSWIAWNQWELADYFLYHSSVPATTLLWLARLPIMLLSLGLGWLIYRASRELFGGWGGVISLSFYVFDPNLIAHSRYVTTDLGFTAIAFLSIYCLARLLQQPSSRRFLVFGIALTAAGLSKFSGIALLIAAAAAWLVLALLKPAQPFARAASVGRWLLIGLPAAALLTWAIYGFDIRRPADDPRIRQLYSQRETLLQTADVTSLPPLERFAVEQLGDRTKSIGAWLENASQYRLPGYAFWRGLFAVIGHSVGGQEAYLLGHYRDRGWWYYFPVAFAVKTPLPTLVGLTSVAIIGASAAWSMRRRAQSWRSTVAAVDTRLLLYGLVPTIFFILSMSSNLNLGWRHLMPIYPFIFVLLGGLVRLPSPRPVLAAAVPVALVANLAVIQVITYPNQLGYFNALVGGSANGPRYLLDSNLDWGQDLPKLARFIQKHNLPALPFAYYGRAELRYFVPNATPLPSTEEVAHSGRPNGLVAISIGELFRRDGRYRWLWAFRPIQTIGSSIYVYRI
ncbi:MAG: glycosyltransferase family 39 protein [Candidatus Kerfeldbacteria bacterium]|nr:glycosyltransferase family 39 protein [Candidatus Kerfeldbacteria bacterium]